jgi:catechol 2,3-dioxygenase-like lactoylglutathione lyase family enzyme
MLGQIEALVTRFERGSLSRREFVHGVVSVAAATAATAQGVRASTGSGEPPTLAAPSANSLNHVSLAVSDIDASQRFYERVLGVSEVSRQFNGVNLGLGDSFLGLYDIDPPGRIHHFCVGVDDYVIERTAEQLREHGIEPRIRQDRPELYFNDPDGITVQLSEPEYRG